MRIHQVEKGESILNQMLIRFISMVSGMRLPDAARIVMYHKDFYGAPMAAWTHAAMRGKSNWTVGEREMMAAMTAKWNACPFCVEAHGAIASIELGDAKTNDILADKPVASPKLQVILPFLEKLTLHPEKISVMDVQTIKGKGISDEEIEDAIAVSSLFNITARCANAFNFALLTKADLKKASKRMLTKGYVFGKTDLTKRADHRSMAETLRQRIFEGQGVSSPSLRQAIAQRAIGGPSIEEPYDQMALLIGEASYKVTDDLVMNVIKKAGSDKAAFELMVCAAVSAGLYRWNMAVKVLNEAVNR
jgi:uncharacterized peroxidase-related enzyme